MEDLKLASGGNQRWLNAHTVAEEHLLCSFTEQMILELVDATQMANADVIVKHHHHQENATR